MSSLRYQIPEAMWYLLLVGKGFYPALLKAQTVGSTMLSCFNISLCVPGELSNHWVVKCYPSVSLCITIRYLCKEDPWQTLSAGHLTPGSSAWRMLVPLPFCWHLLQPGQSCSCFWGCVAGRTRVLTWIYIILFLFWGGNLVREISTRPANEAPSEINTRIKQIILKKARCH